MRLKSHILTLAILVLPFVCVAQRNANHWIFGDSVWLEFVDTGIIQRNANIYTYEGASSINKTGTDSLLFYGTPNKVYNNSGELIVNGLYGHHSAAQGALFLGHPDSDTIIHLFTSDDIGSRPNMGLYHHILGASGSILLMNDTLLFRQTEQLSAINHRNNRDIWLAAHKVSSDSFYLYLLQDQGLLDCPIIFQSGNPYTASSADGVILKFSPDSKFLVGTLLYGNEVELYQFNAESGKLFNPIVINITSVHGAEFSSNSQRLYVTSSAIYQLDISDYDAPQIKNSMIRLSPYKSNTGYLQLGIDGRIYLSYILLISDMESKFLSVVNYPDIKGNGCGFEELGFSIQHGQIIGGLPSFNQSYFYSPSVDFSYRENCNTLEYEFEAQDTFNASNFTWNFTNPDSSSTSSKLGQTLSYQFYDTGQWTVQLIASNGTKADTVTKIITIRPAWKPDFLGNDTFYCAEDKKTVAFNLKTPPNMHCVHWMGNPAYGQPDSFVVYTAGTYFVKVTNKSFCTTFDTITIKEIQNPSPPLIVRIEDTLVSDADSVYYRWYKDDVIQTNDTLRNLVLRDNGTYFLKVFDDSGCAAISNSILVDNIAVNEKAQHRIQIYPNPTNGTFTIKGLTEPALSIQVFDHKGALVTQLDPVGDTHDIAKLPEGFYVVRVLTNGGLYQARLVLY